MVRFRVPRAVLQFPTRRIPDSKRKNFPDLGIRISLYGANIMYDETFCFYSLVSWLGETVITARNCAKVFKNVNIPCTVSLSTCTWFSAYMAMMPNRDTVKSPKFH